MEGNLCANFLAKLRTRSTTDLLIVFDYPIELHLLVTADGMSVAYHCGQ